MEFGSILLAIALCLLVAAFIARPFIEKALPQGEAARASDLITQREAVLIELRDLDFDHTTGKLAEDDYQTQRARLVARGAEILKALDQLPSAAPQTSIASPFDDEIERQVAERRQKLATTTVTTCPNCHKPIQPNDNFCPSCGAKLIAAQS